MLTLFLIGWPLFISLLLLLGKPAHAKVWAFTASLIELIVSVIVLCQFDGGASNQFGFNIAWMPAWGIRFHAGIDGISLLLVMLTTVMVPFIILSSFRQNPTNPSAFYGLMLLMQMALVGVFTALDGFVFYLFWELALIPIYFICMIWGGEARGRITLKFFIYTLTGSLFMLIALVYLYQHSGGGHSFDIQALYEAGRSLTKFEQGFVFWALFLAFAIKMPVFPFHTWQPDTYTVAPAQGTMLLSAIMLKMGVYGVIRWLIPIVPQGFQEWGFVAISLSVIGIIYASSIAIVQRDFKRLIAYSSIAHVGLISAGVLTLNEIGLQGAMIQMISHGLIVFALFYIVEIIFERTRTRRLAELGGIRNVAPVLSTIFLIVLLGSVALPLTSGFVGEFLLINALVHYSHLIGTVAGLTIILGAVYMLRTFQKSMSGETTAATALFTDLSGHERTVLFPIVFLVLLIGVYPGPLLAVSASAVHQLLEIYHGVIVSSNY